MADNNDEEAIRQMRKSAEKAQAKERESKEFKARSKDVANKAAGRHRAKGNGKNK